MLPLGKNPAWSDSYQLPKQLKLVKLVDHFYQLVNHFSHDIF